MKNIHHREGIGTPSQYCGMTIIFEPDEVWAGLALKSSVAAGLSHALLAGQFKIAGWWPKFSAICKFEQHHLP